MSFKNAYDSDGLNKETEKKLKDLKPSKSSSKIAAPPPDAPVHSKKSGSQRSVLSKLISSGEFTTILKVVSRSEDGPYVTRYVLR